MKTKKSKEKRIKIIDVELVSDSILTFTNASKKYSDIFEYLCKEYGTTFVVSEETETKLIIHPIDHIHSPILIPNLPWLYQIINQTKTQK